MEGSKKVNERINILSKCDKIIFNSLWTKNRFFHDMEDFYKGTSKAEIINQCAKRKKIDLGKKEKIITFVGKLNSSKGYDLFGKAILKILKKNTDWKAIVIGDERREKLVFTHKKLTLLGFQEHNKVLKILEKTSISVTCSKWNEPFGRTSLEASCSGCAVIISNRGGLTETITDGIIIKEPTINNVYKSIDDLVKNKKKRVNLQKNSIKNFYLTDKFVTKKIDDYRFTLIKKKNTPNIKKNLSLKIVHITNFNERHNGRLFYNTGRRINNGLIRLGHSVLEVSDRDVQSVNKKITDLSGAKYLNTKLLKIIGNYIPDIIILGHADLINLKTLNHIKNFHPQIKFAQWFLDRMGPEWKFNEKRFLNKIDIMNASFCTTDPKFLNFGKRKNIHFIPNPVDESFEKLHNYKLNNFKNDVFFAISHGVHRGILKKGKFDAREVFINTLLNKLPNIKFDLPGIKNKQPKWADSFIEVISQSKIALNLSQGKTLKYYSSDRLAQLMGNGLLVMIDKKTKYSDFFNNNELIFYNDLNDLAKKIKKYSENDVLRKKIAKQGRDKYFKYFNSTIVAKYIIDKTFKIKKKYFWDTKS